MWSYYIRAAHLWYIIQQELFLCVNVSNLIQIKFIVTIVGYLSIYSNTESLTSSIIFFVIYYQPHDILHDISS